ncbi:ABC transporter transmembrane domain-containing protein [Peribacillus frigoritolerans]|uniref:ABC transporter transmembrane domain-containing protein n=1 Tax=Peribacillus frigoritolerans TaxID=450367 RepID=UPI001EFF53DB|nr:ABC transporter transmembrane domain-containing protein [Peribacillus frigoritolerans]WJE48949.1 ABC transporter transmembrane domain-containing protein [Peribacillus frigoritolerans]
MTDTVTFIAVAVYMLFINWKLTIVLLITSPFMLYITRVFGKRIRMSFRSVQSSAGDVSNQLQDSISGMRLIQSFSRPILFNKSIIGPNMERSRTDLRFAVIFS